MSEKELIIGMAIGDGCITKHGNLTIKHSVKQYEYFKFKKELLKNQNIKLMKDGKHKLPSGYGVNEQVTLNTSCTQSMKQLRQYLYPNGKKVIPDDLIITPLMWSLIYQDDGRQNKSNHYTINHNGKKIKINYEWVNRYTIYTDSFDIHSVENMVKSLKTYNIEATINYSNKNKLPHIHIYKKASKENFKQLILPYMCECMLYKLNLPTYINLAFNAERLNEETSDKSIEDAKV